MNSPLDYAPFDAQHAQSATASVFAFQSRKKAIATSNAQALDCGTKASLEDRLTKSLKSLSTDQAIVGAIPFHYDDQADSLFKADAHIYTPLAPRPVITTAPNWNVTAEPTPEIYADAVSRALGFLTDNPKNKDDLTKIVLARSLKAVADRPIDMAALFNLLALDPAANVFQVALPKTADKARYMVGASPELLVSKYAQNVASHPLAGSARRSNDLAADAQAARDLAKSDKDRREHGIVVEYILDILAPFCKCLKRPDGMTLTSTKSMWHLGTRIEGDLKDADIPVPLLTAALHPTPAVCGWPKLRAEKTIMDLEPFDRDFFTGAVGWCEANGDGEWFVTLRCAEIMDDCARLYAGAGIVPGSDPWSEARETGAKMGAMMSALNIPPHISISGEKS